MKKTFFPESIWREQKAKTLNIWYLFQLLTVTVETQVYPVSMDCLGLRVTRVTLVLTEYLDQREREVSQRGPLRDCPENLVILELTDVQVRINCFYF